MNSSDSVAIILDKASDLIATSRWRETIDELERALSLVGESDDPALRASILHNIGLAYQQLGRAEDASEYYRKSLAISPHAGVMTANTLLNLGLTETSRGNFAEATESYTKALKIFESVGDMSGIAGATSQIALTKRYLGEPKKALELFRQALSIYEKINDHRGMALALHNMGLTSQDLGQIDVAEGYYRDSLSISKEVGDLKSTASTMYQLASIRETRGDAANASDLRNESFAIFEKIGEQPARTTSGPGPSEPREALLDAIDSALSVMGDIVKQVVYQRLERDGLKREQIPNNLGEFERMVRPMFGSTARIVLELIEKNLYDRLSLHFVKHLDWHLVDYFGDAMAKQKASLALIDARSKALKEEERVHTP